MAFGRVCCGRGMGATTAGHKPSSVQVLRSSGLLEKSLLPLVG